MMVIAITYLTKPTFYGIVVQRHSAWLGFQWGRIGKKKMLTPMDDESGIYSWQGNRMKKPRPANSAVGYGIPL